MPFNSVKYLVFFIIVLVVYYMLPRRWQNRMLLLTSYVFYGFWDWRFLSLILISTLTDYFCGIKIHNEPVPGVRRKWLLLSLLVNFGLLGFFKYWDFFAESLKIFLSSLGVQAHWGLLHIILPVGMSFYTLKTITYTLDIYRGEMTPTNSLFDYALFVSFFPQLVAGPIDRAKQLLPQISEKVRKFDWDQLGSGLRLMFWGLFQKVFVADNLAVIVNSVYGNTEATGMQYVVATWAFAFQIYADFSGYSDMAVGAARCFGIELMQNFRQPYFAINPSDFWRRWHISLSSWLRDYLYISLGGNRKGKWRTQINLFLTMLLGGLWHGAAWNFVLWGGYHGLLLAVYRPFRKKGSVGGASTQKLWLYALKAFVVFQMICVGWIFFRAQSLEQIFLVLSRIVSSPGPPTEWLAMLSRVVLFAFIPMFVMAIEILIEIRPSWFGGNSLLARLRFSGLPLPAKGAVVGLLTYLICFYGAKAQSFIYQQF